MRYGAKALGIRLIYGFFLSYKDKVGIELSLIIAFFAGVQFYQIASGSQMAFARYTITLGTFTAILGAYGLHAICQKYPDKRLALRFLFVAILRKRKSKHTVDG